MNNLVRFALNDEEIYNKATSYLENNINLSVKIKQANILKKRKRI